MEKLANSCAIADILTSSVKYKKKIFPPGCRGDQEEVPMGKAGHQVVKGDLRC